MRILSVSGSFGNFDGERRFDDGFSLLTMPNEAGKTTLCAFIRALLYGVPTSDRRTADNFPVRERYAPWSGKPMGGRLLIEKDGRTIELSRTTAPRGKPMQVFSAIYPDTGSAVPADSQSVGEFLTGVSADVFERSAFITGESLAVRETAELERRIAALVTGGNEDVAAADVLRRLNDARNRRRSNSRTGELPQLEQRIRECAAELEKVNGLNADILRLDAAHDAAGRKLAAVRDSLAAREKSRLKLRLDRLHEAENAAEDAETEAERFISGHGLTGARADRDRLRSAADAFRRHSGFELELRDAEVEAYKTEKSAAEELIGVQFTRFEGLTPEFAAESAASDRAEATRLLAAKGTLIPLIPAALAVGAGVALLLMKLPNRSVSVALAALAFCLAAVCGSLAAASYFTAKKRRAAGEKLLADCGVAAPQDMTRLAAEYAGLIAEKRQRKIAAEVAARKLAELRDRERLTAAAANTAAAGLGIADERGADALLALLPERDRLASAALGAKKALALLSGDESADALAERIAAIPDRNDLLPQLPEDRLVSAEATLDAEQTSLAGQRKLCEGRLTALADKAELESTLCALRERLEEAEKEFAALTLAMDALRECAETISARLAPRLGSRAEQLFSRLTGGRYDRLLLKKTFAAEVQLTDDPARREANYLSRGTLDLLYICVRIALSETLCGDALPPLVIDDAALTLDSGREARLFALLRELAGTRQIIYFTCKDTPIS